MSRPRAAWENNNFVAEALPTGPNYRALGAYRLAGREGVGLPPGVEEQMLSYLTGNMPAVPAAVRRSLPAGAPVGPAHALQMRAIRGRGAVLEREAVDAEERARLAAIAAAAAEREAAIARAAAEAAAAQRETGNRARSRAAKKGKKSRFFNSNSNSNSSKSKSRSRSRSRNRAGGSTRRR